MKRLWAVAVCATLCSVSSGQLVGLWETPQPDRDCIGPAERKLIDREIAKFQGRGGWIADQPSKYPFYPQAGTLWDDIWVNNFTDVMAGAGILDYACGDFTYEGHQGHDSDIRSFAEMEIGVPIYAALPGTVVSAHDGEYDRNTSGNNLPANYVILHHGGTHYSLYWHLKRDSVQVSAGQAVRLGQQIGRTGSSGISTYPHLHFESQINGAWYEPSAGACRTGESFWTAQTPDRRTLYLREFAMTDADISQLPGLPWEIPRTGTFRTSNVWEQAYTGEVYAYAQNVSDNSSLSAYSFDDFVAPGTGPPVRVNKITIWGWDPSYYWLPQSVHCRIQQNPSFTNPGWINHEFTGAYNDDGSYSLAFSPFEAYLSPGSYYLSAWVVRPFQSGHYNWMGKQHERGDQAWTHNPEGGMGFGNDPFQIGDYDLSFRIEFEGQGPVVRFYALMQNLYAFSYYDVHIVDPNGNIRINHTGHFNNPQPRRSSWGWWQYTLPSSNIGEWTVRLRINGELLVEAPFRVIAVGALAQNRPPRLDDVSMQILGSGANKVARCQATVPLVRDPDYDIPRFRYVWKLNGTTVRDETTAAHADILDSGLMGSGCLTCQVTLSDGRGGSASLSAGMRAGRTGDTNGDDCVDDVDLALCLAMFGHVGSSPADFNCDGTVDDVDLSLVLERFGDGC